MSAGGVTRRACRLKSSRGDVGFKEKIVTCAGGVVMGRLPPSVPNGHHVSAVPFIAVTAVKRVLFWGGDRETQLCVCRRSNGTIHPCESCEEKRQYEGQA